MKKMKWMVLFCIAIFFAGCGSSQSYDTAASSSGAHKEAAMEEKALSDEAWDAGEMDAADTGKGDEALSGNTVSQSASMNSQKLIKYVDLSAETKKFDELLDNITKKVTELGGYIESSQIDGNSYSYSKDRWGYLTVRIPADHLDALIESVESAANITSKSESVEDVTLEYVDMESHVKALRAEQESLMNILEAATKLEDIIKVQSQLTQVRYEIESYESQLRTYDNLVSYSTVNINISEVEREGAKEPQTFGEEVSARLNDNFYNIKQGLRSFAVWFISSLPYLILWAAVLGILAVFGRMILKKTEKNRKDKAKRKKKAAEEEHLEEEDTKKDTETEKKVDSKD